MDRFPISGCTIIRDAIDGAFCLFESMVTMLPIVDDMHVLDMGSTDGTLELLQKIADANDRIHLHSKNYPWVNPATLATAANDVIALCKHDNVLFWQADEIWHERLVQRMVDMFEQGQFNMIFWRYQLRDNFQKMHWLPHLVHRVGNRNNGMFHFIKDGMNTEKAIGAVACTDFHGDWQQWVGKDPKDIPTYDMILDVCSLGAFRDNIVKRKRLHHPLWNEPIFTIEGVYPDDWQRKAETNLDWIRDTTPFDIPKIMRWHVGKVKYELRPRLQNVLMTNAIDDIRRMLWS